MNKAIVARQVRQVLKPRFRNWHRGNPGWQHQNMAFPERGYRIGTTNGVVVWYDPADLIPLKMTMRAPNQEDAYKIRKTSAEMVGEYKRALTEAGFTVVLEKGKFDLPILRVLAAPA